MYDTRSAEYCWARSVSLISLNVVPVYFCVTGKWGLSPTVWVDTMTCAADVCMWPSVLHLCEALGFVPCTPYCTSVRRWICTVHTALHLCEVVGFVPCTPRYTAVDLYRVHRYYTSDTQDALLDTEITEMECLAYNQQKFASVIHNINKELNEKGKLTSQFKLCISPASVISDVRVTGSCTVCTGSAYTQLFLMIILCYTWTPYRYRTIHVVLLGSWWYHLWVNTGHGYWFTSELGRIIMYLP